MDRHMRRSLAACGLGCLLAAVTGCRNLRSEVPPEPSRSHAARGEKAGVPSVGFSSEPPPVQGNPFPNGAPGSGTVPGMQGAGPMFSPNAPQAGRGQLTQPPAEGLDQIPFQGNANPVRGEMGSGGAAPSPY